MTNRLAHTTPSLPRLAAATLLAGILTACGAASPTGVTTPPPATPTVGWLTVQLQTPSTNDGAVQLQVSGPGVDSVAVVGYNGIGAIANGQANIIVTGQVAAGTVAQVRVPDLARAAEYRASVVAAAARGSYQLQSLAGYRAVLVR